MKTKQGSAQGIRNVRKFKSAIVSSKNKNEGGETDLEQRSLGTLNKTL